MTAPGAGRRVLLVEDAADLRLLLQVVLEADGYAVTVCADGHGGLQAAREQHPDVVLLDVQLPGLDGPDVLRALRADPVTAHLSVVFLTAQRPDDDAGLLELGARGVLRKPFDPASLGAELAALL